MSKGGLQTHENRMINRSVNNISSMSNSLE